MRPDDFHNFCSHPLLAGLLPSEFSTLRAVTRVKSFRSRKQVLQAGEPCHIIGLILAGTVKLSVPRDPRGQSEELEFDDEAEMMVSMLGFGDLIGAISVLSGEQQTASVWTVQATRIAIFSAEDFVMVLEKHPVVSRNLNSHFARTIQQLGGHAVALSTLDVPGRLAFQLLRFVDQHGQVLPNGEILVSVPLTQSDLADLCGASREQINRVFKNWKRQGLLSMPGKAFLIHQPISLKRLTR